ncbi:MAG: hypothetical protein MJ221_03670 [Bacilli bacterium]|nr:hypothetical protein [Bacilli bacterium]
MKKTRGIEHKRLLSIANNYKFSQQRIKDIKRKTPLSDSQKAILNLYENYVKHIETVLGEFNLLDQCILDREYFAPFPKGWWMEVYPRSTFYRLRLGASRKFLELFK